MRDLAYTLPLELRAVDDADGRTLEGRIVPYGETIDFAGTREGFAPGVFTDVEPSSVVLLWQHDQTAPIGRMTELAETDDGAYGTFRLADTERAREARSLIGDGIVKGLSVGFTPLETKKIEGVQTYVRARLRETSLVTFPAYPTAGVLAVRKGEDMEETVIEAEEKVTTPAETEAEIAESRWLELSQGLREVRNQIGNIFKVPSPEPHMTLSEAYAEMFKLVLKDRQERALADVIGTGTGNAEGLIYNQFVAQVLGYMDVRRPLFSAAGTASFPSSGYGLVFPRITQHTLVQKRTGEKTEVASRELTAVQAAYGAEWFAGAVDISIELIEQSEPSVLEVVSRDLLGMYAVATETEFATDVAAVATATGDTLTFTTWGDFVADVVSASAAIQVATGAPGDRLALTSASWLNLMVLLNPSQPATSFNTAPDFTVESVNVGGITAFHAPKITVDTQFNTTSLQKAEKAPVQVSATNVALMGRDVGIIGATIFLPLYPAGILKHSA